MLVLIDLSICVGGETIWLWEGYLRQTAHTQPFTA
jgi:hypothetical protein